MISDVHSSLFLAEILEGVKGIKARVRWFREGTGDTLQIIKELPNGEEVRLETSLSDIEIQESQSTRISAIHIIMLLAMADVLKEEQHGSKNS